MSFSVFYPQESTGEMRVCRSLKLPNNKSSLNLKIKGHQTVFSCRQISGKFSNRVREFGINDFPSSFLMGGGGWTLSCKKEGPRLIFQTFNFCESSFLQAIPFDKDLNFIWKPSCVGLQCCEVAPSNWRSLVSQENKRYWKLLSQLIAPSLASCWSDNSSSCEPMPCLTVMPIRCSVNTICFV